MMPEATAPPFVTPAARVLTIKFVRVDGQRITGAIEPYQSPDCGCLLLTVFRGALKGDRVEGEFVTLHSSNELRPQEGTWWVTRQQHA